jgi:ribosomal protein L11 methyltransferase
LKKYTVVTLIGTQDLNDLLVAFLADLGYDSFEETSENELVAYIEETIFDENSLKELLTSVESFENISYHFAPLENKNWNEEWEKSFEPIIVDDLCAVRAPFHQTFSTPYEIVIEPRMAFGTGHHATTEMMISFMLSLDFKNKKVLDFGCGTAILAILAEKLGAAEIFANDIEEPAEENSISNALLNNCHKIEVKLGGIEVVPPVKYDIILANVNTHAILDNGEHLYSRLSDNGIILFSGILAEQKETIINMARILNLSIVGEKLKNNWVALLCQKQPQTN